MWPSVGPTMVQQPTGDDLAQKIHPFFSKGLSNTFPQPVDKTAPSANEEGSKDGSDSDGIGKKRKIGNGAKENEPKKRGRPRRSEGTAIKENEPSNGSIEALGAQDPDTATESFNQLAIHSDAISTEYVETIPASEPLQIHTISPQPPILPAAVSKKVLKFDPKTGTLGSPPKPKQKTTPSRIVSIVYGKDEATRKVLGEKITLILEGKLQLPKTPTKPRAGRPKKAADSTTAAAGTLKSTHPFFSGMPNKKLATSNEVKPVGEKPARQSIFMSTPVSPKKPRVPFVISQRPNQISYTGGTKVPGAVHPMWPPLDMAHIRGLESPVASASTVCTNEASSRKSKGNVVTISAQESILFTFTEQLQLDHIRSTIPRDDNDYAPAPEELRVPTRHFESGRKLQQRIRPRLRTYRSDTTFDDLSGSQDEAAEHKTKRCHPAIKNLYESLETNLSAYDRSTCEGLSWAQKYAPQTACQVLQAGKEGPLLREWLGALKVQSVDTGVRDTIDGKGKIKSEAAPKKRRKKNRMDGFIVDSDEEANEMGEVSEEETDWLPTGSGSSKKTVIRSGDMAAKGGEKSSRLTNAAVISGPHGSGKTAAVFAVAKELGFEIFEINSSSRRNGKDILEKVGDMTQNHLVQRHGTDQLAEGVDDDSVAQDVKSGKQGMMTSFFKPNTTSTKKASKPQGERGSTTVTKSTSSGSQKQSLILVEEVDVIYEEDKQFWATLMGLMAQSKRPFIMTCNDESLVPLQSLNLHGIFRFFHSPTDLAVDLCLLVAANEGHVLERSAVASLYVSRNYDLRATLTELNYWCQIGVGDRRGGFDWFYLRWPKGSDLDGNGDVVRVISEDTYEKGMGWIGRDLIATCPDELVSEEESMHQSWDSWKVDMSDWQDTVDMASWASAFDNNSTSSAQGRLDQIAAYADFSEAMSVADLCAMGSLNTDLAELLDPTLPDIAVKARDDYIIGRSLLDTSPYTPALSPQRGMAISLKSLARNRMLQVTTATAVSTAETDALNPVTETKAVSILDNTFSTIFSGMNRMDVAIAFDAIAINEKAASFAHLDPSVFDRTLRLIVLDVAPWVRGIVAYDHELMMERRKLSNLLSEGGKRKRMRNTRAAYSALEGGERRTTRRERYFGDRLTTGFVMRTGGDGWQDALKEVTKTEAGDESVTSRASSMET